MGKRSTFERREGDFYPTPRSAVLPLIPWLRGVRTFAEPCCGDGALVRHLESFGLRCAYAGDIATGQDALALDQYGGAQVVITNPPYTRPLMHALIWHFARILPTWLLLETDWASTKQAAPFMPSCSNIVSVGRLRWIEGTTMSGMQNLRGTGSTLATRPARFFMRMGQCRCRRTPPYAGNAASLTGRSDPTPGSARTPAGNVLIAAGWRKPRPPVTKRDTTRCMPRYTDGASGAAGIRPVGLATR